MTIIHPISTDLVRPGLTPRVYAMQYDSNTRVVELTLTAQGQPWIPPADSAMALSYRKADGTRGFYNELSPNVSAVSLTENRVSVTLAPQVLTAPGTVEAALVLASQGRRVGAFPFEVHVAPDPGGGTEVSDDFIQLGGGTTTAGSGLIYYNAQTDTDYGQFLHLEYDEPHDWTLEFSQAPQPQSMVFSASGQMFMVVFATERSVRLCCLADLKGEPGQPGYTPQKGTDYFTPADKTALVEDILSEITQATALSLVKQDNTVTVTVTLADGASAVGTIALNEQGDPHRVTLGGQTCDISWEGF